MPGPETTTQQSTTDWQAKDAEIVASRPTIGSTTLDLFEGNLGRHAEFALQRDSRLHHFRTHRGQREPREHAVVDAM